MKKRMKGFTLVELIVVIAIIGVLAAILVPSMMGYVKSSRLKTANSNAKLVYTTAATYCADQETLGKPVDYTGKFSCISAKADEETPKEGDTTTTKGVQDAVINALSDNGKAAGEAYLEIKANSVSNAEWHKQSGDKVIGRYPNPGVEIKGDAVNGEDGKPITFKISTTQ